MTKICKVQRRNARRHPIAKGDPSHRENAPAAHADRGATCAGSIRGAEAAHA